MSNFPYRRMCATCSGPIGVFERQPGMPAVAICPLCSDMPEWLEVIAQLPTLSFLEHAESCSICRLGVDRCPAGVECLADYPGARTPQAPEVSL